MVSSADRRPQILFGVRPSPGAATWKAARRDDFGRGGVADISVPGRCTLHAFWNRGHDEESRKDSGSKPRVARNELAWETAPKCAPTLKGLWRCSIPSLDKLRPQPFHSWSCACVSPRAARSSQPVGRRTQSVPDWKLLAWCSGDGRAPGSWRRVSAPLLAGLPTSII